MSQKTKENRGCLFTLLSIFTGKASTKDALPYRMRDDFLSPAESSFFQVLRTVVGESMAICPKVGLSDLFFVNNRSQNFSYVGKISQKHVDFVLCEARTMRPKLAIELDDTSHNRTDRKERDAFVDEVFQGAGLPLLHIPVQQAYNVQQIREQLSRVLQPATPAAIPTLPPLGPNPSTRSAAPLCPKCGIPMVLRTSTRGDNAGTTFYGCANYPRCREVRSAT